MAFDWPWTRGIILLTSGMESLTVIFIPLILFVTKRNITSSQLYLTVYIYNNITLVHKVQVSKGMKLEVDYNFVLGLNKAP